jgi:hypothetical protein
MGGCFAVKSAGKLTVTTIKTTGGVAVAAVKTGGSIATSAVHAGTSVAGTGLRSAASLSKAGAIVIVNPHSGALIEVPSTQGIALGVAVASMSARSAKLVRKNTEREVPRDRWAATYLQEGDVVVVDDEKR